ncbi:MAG: bifunctional 4-hydroxy-2-oxoglutarate aldolase/2-dehydro-3-deoxy-phosphogluconate aldolase [Bacteroidota bacterium]|jgi:2-dehydro-3-deoxyphosphogluconate aldolase/(4S)-4-hydroxy-2-oxoglutarate aldolase
MEKILNKLSLAGIVPVIAIDDAGDAEPLAQALIDGGLPCAEITFRTAAAKEAMTRISKKFPSMLMGAGTVLTVDQVNTAVDCGAAFIVSPGLNPKVAEYCVSKGIPVTPGVATPSDIERAIELGLTTVKFFPAEANGGLPFLKAISAPYKQMKFIPTGGIDESNLLSYLKFPPIRACGGSWMVKSEMIANKQFDEIKKLTERAVQLMLGFELKHVGMNTGSPGQSMDAARELSMLLSLPIKEGNSSNVVGTQFEVMKKQYLGTNGHLAVGTNFIHRAIAHLESRGYSVKHETAVEKNNDLIAVYLDKEIAGFAIHLLQK